MQTSPTLAIATLAIIANGVMLFMSRKQLTAQTLSAAHAWLCGSVAMVAGIILYLVPNQIPFGLELVASNTLLLGGLMGYNLALRRFYQLPIATGRLVIVLILVGIGILLFHQFVPDIRVRVVIASIAWLWIMGDSLQVVHQGGKSAPSPARTALFWLYALVFMGTTLRMLYFVTAPVSPTLDVTDTSNWVNQLSPILAILLPVAGSSAFMMMCYHQQYHAARQQALTDILTGLGNRAMLTQLADQHARGDRRFQAVALVDLDNFKRVNDTLGHAAGDAMLVETARRLRSLAGPTDAPIRLGGDEFIMLLGDDHSPDALHALGRQLTSLLAQPYEAGNGLQASVGIAVADSQSRMPPLESLIQQADQRMYRAKRGQATPAEAT